MKEYFLVKGYYQADDFVLGEGSLEKGAFGCGTECVCQRFSVSCMGNSERFNASDLHGAYSPSSR